MLLQDLRQSLEGWLKVSCSSVQKKDLKVKADVNKQGRERILLWLVPILSKASSYTEAVKLALFFAFLVYSLD